MPHCLKEKLVARVLISSLSRQLLKSISNIKAVLKIKKDLVFFQYLTSKNIPEYLLNNCIIAVWKTSSKKQLLE